METTLTRDQLEAAALSAERWEGPGAYFIRGPGRTSDIDKVAWIMFHFPAAARKYG